MTATTAPRMDECLSKRNGHLFIEELDTVDLIGEFGSPLFLISEDQIRRNVKSFQNAFQKGWSHGPVKVLPAAKANWITAVQRILADEGCGCDIYSPGELSVALQAGFEPDLISVNGVPKDRDHIFRCVKEGVRITIDSVEEVDVIGEAAQSLSLVAKVRLRLKPVLSDYIEHTDFVGEGLVPTDIAAMAYKGGLTFDQIRDVGPRILQMKNVELVGFHEHHGRHNRGTRYWVEQMKAFAAEIGKVSELLDHYQPQEIDIGGGFAVPRDPFNAATDYTEPAQLAALYALSKSLYPMGPRTRYGVLSKLIDQLETHPNKTPAPSIEAYADACTRTLSRELPRHGIRTDGLMLQLEPGRSLHGNTGIHLATVTNIKRVTRPIRWTMVITDTTEFWFTGGRYEHHLHHYLFANKADAETIERADIVGRSCYGDRLMPLVPIPRVEVGDILAMLDTGAYQEVSMSNFNAMPRPATILVTGDRAAVIRRRETEKDVFRRDEIPGHLDWESRVETLPLKKRGRR